MPTIHSDSHDGKITHRASASRPCPVCGTGTKGCSATADGLHFCRGEPQRGWRELTKTPDSAGFRHYRREDDSQFKCGPTPLIGPKPTGASKDWPKLAASFAASLNAGSRKNLAAKLGLPAHALDALPLTGYNPADSGGPCVTFAEVDAAGNVIGLNRRYKDGSKKAMKGSKRGLTLPTGWRDRPGPVFVAEGASDTLAMHSAGLACVGRPSNSGGSALLVELLHDLPEDRAIIIVGENDRKETGAWPGRDGAEKVATAVATKLRRRILWSLPPEDVKDVRDWLTATTRAEMLWTERGAELLAHLQTNAVPVEPASGVPTDEPNDGPDNPHLLADRFLATIAPVGALRFWRGEFHRYYESAYHPVPDDDQRGELTTFVRVEFLRVHRIEVAVWESKGSEDGKPKVRPVTSRLIGDVLQALRGICLLPACIDAPEWIDGVTGPDPTGLLAMQNGILDLRTLADGQADALLAATPTFFTPTAAPFDFNPNAPEPHEWMKFLREVWPHDAESISTLQEWFGYLLTTDTRQQKILFMVGPKRSGKGTIARVLRELVGPLNVAGPTLGSLATNFGLWPLLGKSVAVIADARLSGRSDAAVITERLLSISGEDALLVDRKFRDPITAKLLTRFVILSNELPRLGDASGALTGRFILLRMTRSFYGHEDHGLSDRLIGELPGILLWAVEGWRQLRERGRFVQPTSAAELVADLENLTSPVGAFVRERCIVAMGARVEVSELYREWRSWCEVHGRKEPGTEETFGRDLRAAVPELNRTRPRTSEGRLNLYAGIRLRTASDPDSPDSGHSGQRGHGDQPLHALPQNGVEAARGLHAREEQHEVVAAMVGRCDHPDQNDQPVARQRYENDDRPFDSRGNRW